jgi:hypothetical protein
MLPPAFCASAGIVDNATANPATRNIRASALEQVADFIDVPSGCVARPVFRIVDGCRRLSKNAVVGKGVCSLRMKSRRIVTPLSPFGSD